MGEKQKTIKKQLIFEGNGIHSGKPVRVVLNPAPAKTGVRFSRTDIAGAVPIQAIAENAFQEQGRQTSIGTKAWKIQTIEHLMTVFHGLQIDNILVEVNGEELPALDGSAKPYVEEILKAGFEEQEAPREYMNITTPLVIQDKDFYLMVVPASEFSISYTLNYQHPDLSDQYCSLQITPENFAAELAPARTFCLKQEAEQLQKMGYGRGADLSNTLVFEKNVPMKNTLRFPNEAARHKVLDLLGDLYLSGQFFKAHVIACRTGHGQNYSLAKKLSDYRTPAYKQGGIPAEVKNCEVGIIKQVLPHRFPFLFLDRVLEIEPGKKIIGSKQVLKDEYFFQGHFPGHPVMPGVLIVEALAQCGGFLLLLKPENQGKIAYFMSIQEAKFRQPVLPGDELRFEVEVTRERSRTGECAGRAYVGEKLVCEGQLRFAVVDAAQPSHQPGLSLNNNAT